MDGTSKGSALRPGSARSIFSSNSNASQGRLRRPLTVDEAIRARLVERRSSGSDPGLSRIPVNVNGQGGAEQ